MRQLEFYPMIQSERVATVHKLPLWRILVPDFWNPSGAAYMLQMCPLQGCSWPLASRLIPLESSARLFQATVPVSALCWLWSHPSCRTLALAVTPGLFPLRMLEPGWDGAWSGKLLSATQASWPRAQNQSDPNVNLTLTMRRQSGKSTLRICKAISLTCQKSPWDGNHKRLGELFARLNRTKQTWQPKILGSPA